jgi:uncharacterized protein (DUF1778 family)
MPAAAEKKSCDIAPPLGELKAADVLELEILERENHVRLSREEFERILDLIENPPKPNEALLRAKAVHRKLTSGQV